MKSRVKKITENDYIIAQRRASRILEIEMYGKPVCHRRMIHRSHKSYVRQVAKRIEQDD